MNAMQMIEDLDYLVNKLKTVHIKTHDGFTEEQEKLIAQAYEQANEYITNEQFALIINKIICSFKDAHTSIWLNNLCEKYLDINFIWLSDGLYIRKDSNGLKKGDKILAYGGNDENAILECLRNMIPAENNYWLKEQSYVLKLDYYLKMLNLTNEDEEITIKIKRGNEIIKKKLKLETIQENATENNNDDWVSFDVDKANSMAVFKLDRCIYNDVYRQKLKEL